MKRHRFDADAFDHKAKRLDKGLIFDNVRVRTTRRGNPDVDPLTKLVANIRRAIMLEDEEKVNTFAQDVLKKYSIETIVARVDDDAVRSELINRASCKDVLQVIETRSKNFVFENAFLDRFGQLPQGCQVSYREAFRLNCERQSLLPSARQSLYELIQQEDFNSLGCLIITSDDVRADDNAALRLACQHGHVRWWTGCCGCQASMPTTCARITIMR